MCIRSTGLFFALLCVCQAALGEDATQEFKFGWFADGDVEGTEVLLFRPDPQDDDHFFLYLEASDDLTDWRAERLPRHAVDAEGMVVVEGGAVQRRFWRLRIRPATRAGDDDWPSGLRVRREDGVVTAALEVRTDYYPAVRLMIEDALGEPVPWEDSGAELDAATEAALVRLREIVDATETRRGEVFEVRRRIEE